MASYDPLVGGPETYGGEDEVKKYYDKLNKEWEKSRKERAKRKYLLKLSQLEKHMRSEAEAQAGPRYDTAFYKLLGEMGGSQPYLDWFESQFSGLLRRYLAGRPEYFYWPGKTTKEKEEYEAGWAEFLEKEKGKMEQKWWGLRPSQRGEKPWAYAPRVQTVEY